MSVIRLYWKCTYIITTVTHYSFQVFYEISNLYTDPNPKGPKYRRPFFLETHHMIADQGNEGK